ncbi:BTB/POZ domain-containing protein [Rhynchospora pubera]|uniref:BTB/POZ domain-containing protein n=1 Tax=Rhynchospora pubera TaxID=906938 RepID=A0AAV8HBQ6_9POAL|nr:BTB/POZ domain-containing protein [Rhynchospora pubera]
MTTVVLGSKTGIFRLNKTTWRCMTELESDVLIEVEDFSFFLHKFPLINASPVLQKIISKFSSDEDRDCAFALDDIPGGVHSFELIAKFCYGEKIELTTSNVVPLICAANYFDMNEDYLKGNLIFQTETFFSNEVLSNWKECIVALLSCEHVLHYAEELDIASSCLNSLSSKVADGKASYLRNEISWNGIACMKETKNLSGSGLDWWHDDICSLNLYFFKRFIEVLNAKGHDPADISNAVIYYARNHRSKENPNSTGNWSVDERILLEEIVELLPVQKGATSIKVLLSMLSASIMLNTNETCIETLEKRVGSQLHEATVEDLLVLNSRDADKAVRNVDCVERLIKQFMEQNLHINEITCNSPNEERLMEADSLQRGRIGAVAKLVDKYLAKVAQDENLMLQQFLALGSAIPTSARPSNDDLYHAISTYLEYHPKLSDEQKEKLCQLIDVQKLSRDLCRDVAQNENLPIRVIVKALFCEMLDLKRTLASSGDENNTGTEVGNATENSDNLADEKDVVVAPSSGLQKEHKNSEAKKTKTSLGEKVMCRFLMARNLWSVRKVKALLAQTRH